MGNKKTLKEKIAEINSRTTFTDEEKALKIKVLEYDDLLERFESDKEAKKRAKVLLEKYLQDYEVETEADKSTLRNLIYLEAMNSRLQDKMDEAYKTTKAVNVSSLEDLHANIDKIQKLKETLGLVGKKEEDSPNQAFKQLYQKTLKWLAENGGGRDFPCPHCGRFSRLVIRVDRFDIFKHPYIWKDRAVANPWLTKLYSDGKITKHDYANILGVADDHIDKLMKSIGPQLIKEAEEIETKNASKVN